MSRQFGNDTIAALPDFVGTPGRDRLRGTNGNDTFDLSQGGHDKVLGLAGDDLFYFGSRFDARDEVNGGDGYDIVELRGRYDGPLVLQSGQIDSVEALFFLGKGVTQVALADVAHVGGQLAVSGNETSGPLQIDGSDVTSTALRLYGYGADDIMIGGAKDDSLSVAGGSDICDGGAGDDTFGASNFYVQQSYVLFGGDGNDTFFPQGFTEARSLFSGDKGNDQMSGYFQCPLTFYFEADSGRDSVTGFQSVADKIWINVAGVDSFDDLTLANGPNGATVVSWGDGSTITVTMQNGYPFLTAKDFRFGVNQQIEDARARVDEVRAFGDTDATPAHDHHFLNTAPHYATPHDAGVLA